MTPNVMVVLTTFLFGIYFYVCDTVFWVRGVECAEIFYAPRLTGILRGW